MAGPRPSWGRAGALAVLLLLLNLSITPAAAATYELTELWHHTIPGTEVTAVALSSTGDYVAAGTEGNTLYLFTKAGVEVWNKSLGALPDPVNGTGFADDTHLYAFSNSTLYLYGTDGTLLGAFTNASTEPILAARATVSGNLVAYVTPTYLFVRNISTGALMGSWQPQAGTTYKWRDVAIKEDGSTVYGLTSSGAIEAYSETFISSIPPTITDFLEISFYASTGAGSMGGTQYGANLNITLQNITLNVDPTGATWDLFKTRASDGTLSDPIPFYIDEREKDQNKTQIWVKMDVVSNSLNTLYLKINTTAPAPRWSNGYQVFPFFENFTQSITPAGTNYRLNSSNWNTTSQPTYITVFQDGSRPAHAELKYQADYIPTLQTVIDFLPGYNITWRVNMSSSIVAPYEELGERTLWTETRAWDERTVAARIGQMLQINLAGGDRYYWNVGASGGLTSIPVPAGTNAIRFGYNGTYIWGGLNYETLVKNNINMDATHPSHFYYQIFGGDPGNVTINSVWASRNDGMSTYSQRDLFFNESLGTIPGYLTFHYSASKTGLTNAQNMDLDNTEKWFSVSATGTWYAQAVDGTTFGTQYSYASGSGAPTARTAVSGAGSFSVEGRGAGIFDVIRLDGTRVGTYTAGGTINGVAVSDNGLWAVAGSNDGIFYAFGKQSSSSWQLIDTSTPAAEVTTVALLADGSLGAAGRSDGTLTLYQVGEATTGGFSQTLHFSRDGSPAAGYTVQVEDGGTSGTSWTTILTGNPTDSNGDLVFAATSGRYYRITVDGQVSIIQASTSFPILYLQWTSPPAFPEYGSGFNVTNGTVDTFYRDPLTVPITVEIKNTDTRSLAYCQTAISNDLALSWVPPAGTHHYQIRITAERPMGSQGGTYYATTGTGTTMELIPVQGAALQILLIVFLMVVAGLFGYVHSPVGALGVSIIAVWCNYMNWLTIPWYWCQLCVLISFMALMSRGADI